MAVQLPLGDPQEITFPQNQGYMQMQPYLTNDKWLILQSMDKKAKSLEDIRVSKSKALQDQIYQGLPLDQYALLGGELPITHLEEAGYQTSEGAGVSGGF